MNTATRHFDGGCTCRHVRYRMTGAPMFVHCCHCRWCQRETGASFALNALIEAGRVQLLAGEVEVVDTPSNSGRGQRIARCPRCKVAVWSHYAGAGDVLCFVRVGTLDEPDHFPPDVHIFTGSKQPWVVLPTGIPAVQEYYRASELWPEESLRRRAALMAALPAVEGVRGMGPRRLVEAWVAAFNRGDADALAALYDEDAVNHQVAEPPVRGRAAIREMFAAGFAAARMTCIVENLFEDGEWAMLEWRDPLGLRGCGFFRVIDGRIVFQRGYWDKLTFLRQQGLPAPGSQ